MSNTIESLEIEIIGSSQSAEQALDALERSLGRLKTAVKSGCGLTAVTNQLTAMNTALGSMNSSGISNLKALADGLNTLSGIGKFKLSSSIANQITNLGTATKSLNGTDFTQLTTLATALTPLATVGKANLGSTINQLGKLPGAIQPLVTMDMTGLSQKIRDLVEAVKPLSEMGKANLGSTLNQIKKLPEAFATLNALDLTSFAKKIKEVAAALAPLADEMQKVANGFSAFPAKIQKLLNATNQIPKANSRAGTSYVNLAAKIAMAYTAVKRVASVIASWINKSNEYIENLNLFTVAMGDYATEAQKYAEMVGELMGIDPGEWMRNQGVFMTLATGFGVVNDRAYTMSKNLTQLGYDLSSFFNITFEDAMQKLQSGISGELEPLRRLGYDLSQARLEAVALSLGIDKAVSSMTQAEKAELRYYAIMTQVTTAQGDMARTLNAPANQLRVLQAQATQAARALGNIFIPALNAVLPYAIAVAQVIRFLANTIASLFGFSLPEVDYSGIGELASGASDASDAIDDTTGSVKKLKKSLLGIDELNLLTDNSDSGGGGADFGGGGGGFDFELPEYDFLGELANSRVAQIVEEMKEWLGLTGEINSWADFFDTRLGEILTTVGLIGAGFAAWKIAKTTLKGLNTVKKISSKKVNLSFSVIGATLAMSDLDKLKQYFEDFTENGATFANVSGMLSEFAGLIGDALTLLGNTKLGGAMKVIQGLGELVSSINDIAQNGIDVTNVTDLLRGLTNVAIGIGLFSQNLQLTGVAMALQGFTTVIQELGENWEAIKQGDWSGVDKTTLIVGVIEALGGILTALDVFNKLKKATKVKEAVEGIGEVATATETISTTTSTMTTKLTSLVKNLGLGIAVIAEVAAAAVLFVGAIWVLGKELEQVGIAWQPVIDNAETVFIAVGVGTGLLVGIGVATAALGSAGTTLVVNVALGAAMLAELGITAALFLAEILVVGKLLDEIDQAWEPVLDNGEDIATAIGVGTALLVAIGVVAAALGAATVASVGLLPLAIGIGTAMLVELGAAATLFITEICAIGEGLEEISLGWQPVLDDGEAIEDGIEKGTALLVAIGAVTAALGSASVASVGSLPLAIGIGTAMLAELGVAFGVFCDSLSDVSDDIKDTLAPALSGVNDVLPDATSDMSDFIDFMTAFAEDMVIYAASSSIAGIAATIDEFIDFFTTDPIKRMSDEMDEQYEDMKDLVEKLEEVLPLIKDGTRLMDEYNDAMDDFNAVSGNGGGLSGFVSTMIEVGIQLFKYGWTTISNFVGDKVSAAVSLAKSGWTTISSFVGDKVSTAVSLAKRGWSNISSFVGSSVTVGISLVKSGWTTIKNWIGDLTASLKITLPKIRIKWSNAEVLGATVKYPSGFECYAQGGFPAMGQMFVAREAGPELVGTIGNRTAVVNNDQIVASVSQGVYEANSEQNALLREQNNLLRKLLEKDTNVTAVVGTGDVISGFERKNRRDGRTVVPVGV